MTIITAIQSEVSNSGYQFCDEVSELFAELIHTNIGEVVELSDFATDDVVELAQFGLGDLIEGIVESGEEEVDVEEAVGEGIVEEDAVHLHQSVILVSDALACRIVSGTLSTCIQLGVRDG